VTRADPVQPVSISVSIQLAEMTRERIDSLERDKKNLRSEVARLSRETSRLSPENARLQEALSGAESINVVATILIGVGGFLVSYATFTGGSATLWANVSAGLLLAGIILMTWQSVRQWRRG